MSPKPAVLLDVDGTLVDSNYHHVLAWARALARYDLTPSLWRVHRHIGMGGDQFVTAVAGEEAEKRHGDALRDAWAEEFDPLLDEVHAVPRATELLQALRERGWPVVLATSGKPHHVDRFLDLLDARDLLTAWTTSEDVEQTKPATDLIEVSLRKADAERGVMVGDSRWDFESARRAGVPGVGLLTGGFSREELRDAGADEVHTDLDALLDSLDRSLLRAP
jgi:HAD superfamily hydrolase (TIGR01549 family)